MVEIAESVRGINVVIGAETSGLQKALSDVNKKSRDVQSELKQVDRLLKLDPTNTEMVSQKQKLLASAIENTREKLNRLKAAQEQVNDQFAKGQISEGQYRAFQREINKTEQELKKLENQVGQTKGILDKLGISMQDVGQSMTNAGQTMTAAVTLPVVAMGAAAVKASIDMESAFAGVKKTVEATEPELQKLKEGFEQLSTEIPVAATELLGIGEAAGQLGIETKNILGFSEVMAKLGVTTNLSSQQAATALARLANITQMPQDKFDRLGSTIVALGNNLATTEAEITEMALRLAGAGKQIGLSEAQILSFAGALSSVGIEAEAGGSAFSRVMVEMANSVATGGAKLNVFAKTAGMSVEQFKKAFKDDAAEAIISFVEGLDKVKKSGGNVFTTLGQLELSEIRVRDALLRASGAGDLFRNSIALGNKAWEENNALNKEAATRFETSASKLQMFMNKLTAVATKFGDELAPALINVLDKLEPLVNWFGEMDTKSKTLVITVAAVVAALGPLLTMAGSVTTILAGLSVAAGALGVGLGALVGTIGLMGVALAGMVAGGFYLYKTAIDDAIPQVDLFGNTVSEATKKAVQGFIDLGDDATIALDKLYYSGTAITEKAAGEIVSTFDKMGNQIKSGMDQRLNETLTILEKFFADSKALTDAEEAKVKEDTIKSVEDKKKAVEEAEGKIKAILEKASKEKRALTESERAEINRIQSQMVSEGIRALSKYEVESAVILERMRQQSSEISARQAAEVVQNSFKQKDKAVKAAEGEYDGRIAAIVKLRDESKTISADQASKLIADAERQRDETVKAAEDMHIKVVSEAKKQAQEHVNEVEWETGQIKTRWERFKEETVRTHQEIKSFFSILFSREDWSTYGQNVSDGLAQGMESRASRLSESSKKLADVITSSFTDKMKIKSPSEVMAEYGKYIAEGLAKGMEDNQKIVAEKTEKMGEVAKAKTKEAKDKILEQIKNLSDKAKSEADIMAGSVTNAVGNMASGLSLSIDIIKAKFDLFTASLGENANQSDILRERLKMLAEQETVQADRVSLLQKAYDDMVKAKGAAAQESMKLQLELLKEQKVQAELAKTIAETNRVQQEALTKTSAEAVTANFMNGLASIYDVQLAWLGQHGKPIGWDGSNFVGGSSETKINQVNINVTSKDMGDAAKVVKVLESIPQTARSMGVSF